MVDFTQVGNMNNSNLKTKYNTLVNKVDEIRQELIVRFENENSGSEENSEGEESEENPGYDTTYIDNTLKPLIDTVVDNSLTHVSSSVSTIMNAINCLTNSLGYESPISTVQGKIVNVINNIIEGTFVETAINMINNLGNIHDPNDVSTSVLEDILTQIESHMNNVDGDLGTFGSVLSTVNDIYNLATQAIGITATVANCLPLSIDNNLINTFSYTSPEHSTIMQIVKNKQDNQQPIKIMDIAKDHLDTNHDIEGTLQTQSNNLDNLTYI